MNYVTVQAITGDMRFYETKDFALKASVAINPRNDPHPTFYLYQKNGSNRARYVGALSRTFGTDDFFWDETRRFGD